MSTERRVVADSGGAKGSKRCQLAWADPHGLEALGNVCGFGADKYAPTNYRQGYDWSLSLNALERHVLAVKKGEWTDPESGEPHLAHAAWHCLTLIGFSVEHPEFNDLHGGPAERKDAKPTPASMSEFVAAFDQAYNEAADYEWPGYTIPLSPQAVENWNTEAATNRAELDSALRSALEHAEEQLTIPDLEGRDVKW